MEKKKVMKYCITDFQLFTSIIDCRIVKKHNSKYTNHFITSKMSLKYLANFQTKKLFSLLCSRPNHKLARILNLILIAYQGSKRLTNLPESKVKDFWIISIAYAKSMF